MGEGAEIGLINWGEQDTLKWGAKPPNESPVNYPMYGGLGAYRVWLTLGGLPSEQVYGMGLVATDSEAVLLAQPGKVHVQLSAHLPAGHQVGKGARTGRLTPRV